VSDKPFRLQILKSFEDGGGGETLVVEVAGFLDAHTVVEFERRMNELIGNGARRIVLDLSKLNYISSAGIGVIMSLVQRLRHDSGDVVLMRPTQKVYKILELLGFTRIFRITASEQEAMAGLRNGGPDF